MLTRRQSFQPWLQAGAFDIVQPDATKVGGLSESRRIGWMARENGVRMIPHGWNTALGLAADLQLASALPEVDLVEYLTGSPFIDNIAAGGWKLNADGTLPIPRSAGIGCHDRYGRRGALHWREEFPRTEPGQIPEDVGAALVAARFRLRTHWAPTRGAPHGGYCKDVYKEELLLSALHLA